jgi:hypothetical protein
MTDPLGRTRRVFTPLVSYMVDNPEALMLAGVIHKTSPVTMATYEELGDPDPHPRRSGNVTVAAVQRIAQEADPWDDIRVFNRLCKAERYNGVNMLFFRDWAHSDPTWFLTPDRLHAVLKKFWDHDIKWCIRALGESEIDFRFSVLHKRVGFRHFRAGISGLTMTSGREHRDMQRSIVVVIGGGANKSFTRCIRALVDFSYISQHSALSDRDITTLRELIAEFHEHKHVILESGCRKRHWKVPKIELLHNIPASAHEMGAPRQWSTDRTEHAHIEVVKNPFRASNKKDFNPQICRHMDRAEKRRNFDLCTALARSQIAAEEQTLGELRDNPNLVLGDFSTWIRKAATVEPLIAADRDATDYFAVACRVQLLRERNELPAKTLNLKRTFATSSTAFHLTMKIDAKMTIEEAAERHSIPDLRIALERYFEGVHATGGFNSQTFYRYPEPSSPNEPCIGMKHHQYGSSCTGRLPFSSLRIWHQVRIQTRGTNSGKPVLSNMVKATPPSDAFPFGRYDFCVFKNDPDMTLREGKIEGGLASELQVVKRRLRHLLISRHVGVCAAEVRLVFQPITPPRTEPAPFLVYAHRFDKTADQGWYEACRLPRLQRAQRIHQGSRVHNGSIISLFRILTAVDIQPWFGREADERLTSANSNEISKQFVLNIYSDRHIHYLFT